MDLVTYIFIGVVAAIAYTIGCIVGNYRPFHHDGEIKVDQYELKDLVLHLDLPDLMRKRNLIIKIIQVSDDQIDQT